MHREGEGSKKVELRGRKSGRKIEPCGRWEDEWKRVGKKSCKKRDLPFILSLHDARTRQPFHRCLFGRHCNVYILREQSESRSGRLTGFKCQLRYLEKKIFFFFLRYTVRWFSRSQVTRNESALINVNNRNVFLRRWFY